MRLIVLAHNLGHTCGNGSCCRRIDHWSMTSVQRLVKTGGRILKHARYCWLLLAESHPKGCAAQVKTRALPGSSWFSEALR